jgi:hypothetical protein
MKTFLQELAEKVYKQHPVLDEVTMIFPNRRAILYFRKHLSDLLNKPCFSPALLTIEDFISGFTTLKVPDKLELIYQLYKVYNTVLPPSAPADGNPGGVEQFYFWGDMLLRDFDEIDKHHVNAVQLFKDLSHQKELDSSFDFLTDEQKEFLKSFWGNFDETQSANKKKFLYLWRQLPQVYTAFKQRLAELGMAYEGMLHRWIAERLMEGKISSFPRNPASMKFAGFNALTVAEEKIISFFVERGAEVHWDMDAYYVNNAAQEAGKFFREYQQHPVLRKTFPQQVPSHSLLGAQASVTPRIKIFGAAQPVGQAKLMAQVLQEQLAAGMKPEETLIVLPDEKLLLPVLHGLSASVEKMNVTMGFPLSSTPLFNFVELLMDLQINRKGDHFNHRQVLALMGHPYVVAADAASANGKRKEILKHNWVHIPKGYLATEVPLHRLVFRELNELTSVSDNAMRALVDYLKSVVTEIGSLDTLGAMDKEYAFHFLKFFNRFQEVFIEKDTHPEGNAENDVAGMKSFLKLFRQLIRSHRIPFTGEPLKGLQVMGVLETRSLDFKNVFILSLNEGAFPAMGGKGSYIPYTIRKAYKLTTVEHQDAIYAYLFYRMLQRAENICIFYNSETDVLGQGEMSRYLQQLLFESGLPVEKKVLHNPIEPKGINPIVIRKNAQVMENLMKLNEGNSYFRGMSPSALNSYIECRLKFYFRHVAKIREADAVEEELDARVLGNFLHDVMERFYKRIGERKKSRQIEVADFNDYEMAIDALIDEVFIEAYRLDPEKKVKYEGQRLVVKEVVKRFAHRIVEMDKAYAPFVMEALEQEGLTFSLRIAHAPHTAVVSGKIDRVDRKGDQLRVIDYKTGKDKLNFDSVASLFSRDAGRNKAAFQTLLYALLYKKNFLMHPSEHTANVKLVPGLINRMNLFDDGFSFGLKAGKDQVTDAEVFLPEFEMRLRLLFEELFDPAGFFDQTTEVENCKNCPYTQICYR